MNSLSKTSVGKIGEKIVEDYLEKRGTKILVKNFRSKFGEIDLIGKKGDTIIFFEVKTRKTLRFGQPYEAVNKTKLRKIRKTIDFFLLKNPKYQKYKLRIDVISLILDKQNNIKQIKHFENAL